MAPCSYSAKHVLQVFGTTAYSNVQFTCEPTNQRECAIGDLSGKCGNLEFQSGRARELCIDNQLGVTPRDYLFDERYPQNALSVVIRNSSGQALGCAQLDMVQPLVGRAQFRTATAFGDLLFWQTGPDDRTYIRAHITGLRGTDYSLRVFSEKLQMDETCSFENLGAMFSKRGGEFILPGIPNGPPTDDASTVGNLDNLLPLNPGDESLRTTVSTSHLPLFGPHSILQRTVGFVNEESGEVEACGVVMRQVEYPPSELASLLGYQTENNPPLPKVMIG